MKKVITTFIALLECVSASTASAGMPITFTHEGRGSGLLDGVPFGPSDFSITAFADTGDREALPREVGWFIDHSSAMIEIDGVGLFGILTSTRSVVVNTSQRVSFARAGERGSSLFIGPTHPVFGDWDMTTSIGPISGNGELLQWTNDPMIETTGGILEFDPEENIPVTFTAEVIGAPMPLALLPAAMLFYPRRRGR